jgi:phytoene synthase
MSLPSAEAADLAACRALLRTGSRTFHMASLALPARIRAPASALYAFCRLADDEVDLGGGRADALARLEARLDRIYAGRALDLPADRAVARTVERFGVPRTLPGALIEGLRWDAEERRYETLPDLYAYAARVAGAVGAMMAVLMGVRDAAGLARACDLGVAMQLSNVARDVGEDARAGRLYLPRAWLREAGIDPDAFLAAPRFTPALGEVVCRLLDIADALYERGAAGIARLPSDCRYAIRLAGLLYAAIGHEVARRGGDSVADRAVVTGARKLWLAGSALMGQDTRLIDAPPLAETRYLVEAAAGPVSPRAEGRVAWLVDLFTRLEQRDGLRALGGVAQAD